MERIIALISFIILLPLFCLISLAIKLTSKGNILFLQKRVGKNKSVFLIYKFRTMTVNAEKMKFKYFHLNEAHGPAFKIYNDPRFTHFGKFLSRMGLDELPQLINIIKGEMSFVGPRPLPLEESAKIPKKYKKRFSVLPGITSLWVVDGSHNLTFDQWMKSDVLYTKKKSFFWDINIGFRTIVLIIQNSAAVVLKYVFKSS